MKGALMVVQCMLLALILFSAIAIRGEVHSIGTYLELQPLRCAAQKAAAP